jgi:hypothetical protein
LFYIIFMAACHCCFVIVKVMVYHFGSDSHEVMIALIVVLPLIVVVEISLQFHQSFILFSLIYLRESTLWWPLLDHFWV